MIRVKMDRRCVTLEGHAGYGKKGSDIVCAAVSALLYVQMRLLERQGALETCTARPGRAVLLLRPGQGDLSVLELGLRWLEGEYPACLQVEWQGS